MTRSGGGGVELGEGDVLQFDRHPKCGLDIALLGMMEHERNAFTNFSDIKFRPHAPKGLLVFPKPKSSPTVVMLRTCTQRLAPSKSSMVNALWHKAMHILGLSSGRHASS